MYKELFEIIPPSDTVPARGNQPQNIRCGILEYPSPSSFRRSVNRDSQMPSQLEK